MTTVERRGPGRPRDEAIDVAILEATIDELIERGFIAASMESIAARAGIAKTTLYRRWSNTTELAVAAMRSFEEDVEAPPEGTVRDQLVCLIDVMRRRWGNPRYAAVMRRVAADGSMQPETYKGARERLVGPYVRMTNKVLRRGVEEGIIRADVELEFIRQMLVSPIMAAALTHKERLSRGQIELTVDTVLAGLAPSAQ
jgi:AcrR family transcriptional regulator